MTSKETEPRVPMQFRIPSVLKKRVVADASRRGMTLNAWLMMAIEIGTGAKQK